MAVPPPPLCSAAWRSAMPLKSVLGLCLVLQVAPSTPKETVITRACLCEFCFRLRCIYLFPPHTLPQSCFVCSLAGMAAQHTPKAAILSQFPASFLPPTICVDRWSAAHFPRPYLLCIRNAGTCLPCNPWQTVPTAAGRSRDRRNALLLRRFSFLHRFALSNTQITLLGRSVLGRKRCCACLCCQQCRCGSLRHDSLHLLRSLPLPVHWVAACKMQQLLVPDRAKRQNTRLQTPPRKEFLFCCILAEHTPTHTASPHPEKRRAGGVICVSNDPIRGVYLAFGVILYLAARCGKLFAARDRMHYE
eukprot:TRINITY_DN74750_c0_g1_i1.p1 TRINITY_DN74750_c0_g1~~TRINITY_DN74750_c0_g1_i1.p1  ORF type:complete len:323 (+),score=-102.81 TRINITY_DN74750_c0_g1_i1:58-969(+)